MRCSNIIAKTKNIYIYLEKPNETLHSLGAKPSRALALRFNNGRTEIPTSRIVFLLIKMLSFGSPGLIEAIADSLFLLLVLALLVQRSSED